MEFDRMAMQAKPCVHETGSSSLFNYCSEHWFVCHTHKTRWLGGSNIFISWDIKEDWRDNAFVLKQYDEVVPLQIDQPA